MVPEVLRLTAVVAKAISQGHILLIGNFGTGKTDCVKIISALLHQEVLIPTSNNNLKQNLKMVRE